MKKMSRILMIVFALSAFAVSESRAQISGGIYVGVRPPRPHGVVMVRPPRPSPHHVWVAEEWTPGGGAYAYHAGYWAVPPRPEAIWVAGHWRHEHHRGYIWIPGHWA